MKEKVDKIKNMLEENDILSIYQENLNNKIISGKENNIVIITTGNISAGVLSYELNQVIISANELISAE